MKTCPTDFPGGQCLILSADDAGDPGLIPGQGTRGPYLLGSPKLKRLTVPNVDKNIEELYMLLVEWKIALPSWKTVGQFLKKLNVHLPYDLDVRF